MNNNRVPHERLPVVAQLTILGAILGGLFGSLWFIESVKSPPENPIIATPTPAEPLPPVSDNTDSFINLEVNAAAAFVWDAKAQRALYKKNPDEILPLASITKLMTSLLTYELLAPNTRTALPLNAILQDGDSGLMAGETLSAGDLQALALISSSNDAAFALGATVGEALGDQDATRQFVTGMNIRAEELELDSLEFKNTTGLDLSVSEPGAIGSARDVTFLMEYIISEYPELLWPTTQAETRVYNADGAYHEAYNTNQIVEQIPNLLGSKTGYTDLAGGNLTVAFDAGFNRPIIITVLGSTRDGRFTDVERLIEATQATFKTQ